MSICLFCYLQMIFLKIHFYPNSSQTILFRFFCQCKKPTGAGGALSISSSPWRLLKEKRNGEMVQNVNSVFWLRGTDGSVPPLTQQVNLYFWRKQHMRVCVSMCTFDFFNVCVIKCKKGTLTTENSGGTFLIVKMAISVTPGSYHHHSVGYIVVNKVFLYLNCVI